MSTRRPRRSSGASPVLAVLVERELRHRLRDRTFLLSTVISLVVIVGAAVLPAVFDDGPSPWRIGVASDVAESAADVAASAAPIEHDSTVVRVDPSDLRQAVSDGRVDVAIEADGTLLGNESVDAELAALVQSAWRQQTLTDALTDAGVTPDDAAALAAAPARPIVLLDPPDEARDRRTGFVFFGVVLLYGQILGYGFAVASGIVEEKSSRIVEVLLSKVRTRQLLASKLLGIGAIGVAQLLLFVTVGLTAFALSGRFAIPPGVWPSAIALLGWFLVGFAVVASMFAVVGSLAARVEDIQSSGGPVTMLVAGSFMGSVAAVSSPDGTLAHVLSFVPTTGPMVMPIRIASGSATWWDVALSLASCGVAIVLLLRLADHVYSRAALRTSGRTRLRQVLRAS